MDPVECATNGHPARRWDPLVSDPSHLGFAFGRPQFYRLGGAPSRHEARGDSCCRG